MQDIDLYHLLKFYAKKWFWIVIFTTIGAASGYIYSTYIQVPLYKSDATLLLISNNDKTPTQDATLINNYIALLKSRRVLEPVINKQGNKISYDDLATLTTATNEKSTQVIKISIASKNPQMSKELVDGVIASFKEEINKLYKLDNVSIVDNASQDTAPYNVNTLKLTGITTAAGFFSAIALLFFAYDMRLAKKSSKQTLLLDPKIQPKPRRKGGLVNKTIDLLIGTPAEPELKVLDSEKSEIVSKKKTKK